MGGPDPAGDRVRLVLFDIDGTLLHGRPVAHGLALVEAANARFGTALTDADLRAMDISGLTDLAIAVRLLDRAGVAPPPGPRLRAWCAEAAARHRDIAPRHPSPVAAPDAAIALTALRDAGVAWALVTGNIRDIAHDKLRRAGLGAWFPEGPGGFGCDASERANVVRAALVRAGCPAHRAVVVGDTHRDVAAARRAGCGVVAVTTGTGTPDQLRDADAVAATLTGAVEVILARA